MVGFGIVIPLLPFEVMKHGAGGLWYGLILTGFSAAQFFGSTAMGRMSDRFGRKPILLLSLFGTSMGLIALAGADTLWLMLAARVFGGFFAGAISTAQAYVADVTAPAERARYMGWVGSCIGLGFVVGPALGGFLAKHGFRDACYVAAGLSLLAFFFGIFALRESHVDRHLYVRTPFSFQRLQDALTTRPIANIIWAGGLTSMAFVAMQSTLPLVGVRNAGMTEKDLAWVFTVLGAVIIVVQGGLVGRWTPRYGERRLAIAGCVFMMASLLGIPEMRTIAPLIFVLGVFAFGNALVRPTIASLLSQESGAHERGGVLGLGQSIQSGARAVGPLMYGWLYDRHFRVPFVVGIACAIVALALLVAIAEGPSREV